MLHGQNKKTDDPPLALFCICTPFGPPSLLDIPQKEVMFKSKHKLDFSFVSMDQRFDDTPCVCGLITYHISCILGARICSATKMMKSPTLAAMTLCIMTTYPMLLVHIKSVSVAFIYMFQDFH